MERRLIELNQLERDRAQAIIHHARRNGLDVPYTVFLRDGDVDEEAIWREEHDLPLRAQFSRSFWMTVSLLMTLAALLWCVS